VKDARASRLEMLTSAPRIFAFAGLVVFAMQLVHWLPLRARQDTPSDVQVYYRAARHLAEGAPVYGDSPRARLDQPPGSFLYPPTALAMLAPFAHVRERAFQAGVFAVLLVAYWFLAAAIARIATGALTVTSVLATGALLQVAGVTPAISLGNADVIVWATIAWAFAAPRVAGPLLVLGAAIKMYPVVVLVAWLPAMSRRQIRATAAAALGVLGVAALGGVHGYVREWWTVGLPSLSEAVTAGGNWSLSTLLVRPFLDGSGTAVPRWTQTFLAVMPAAAVLAAFVWGRRRPRLEYGVIVLLAAVAFAPICWWWRLTLALLVPVALRVRRWRDAAFRGTESLPAAIRPAPAE
jgi:hypothetical protein